MPVDLSMIWASRRRTAQRPKTGRPHRDRSRNKAQRRARKRSR